VGNRLQLDSSQDGVVAYQYDAANRMIEAGGVSYTWDPNGNLLNDGTSTYTYNYANRLSGVTQDGVTYSYAYNGMGDRLRQNVDGSTTNYTLDLNAGLTQVLADSTHSYLYGRGRIAQVSAGVPQYFLGDALGSVRQVADSTGADVLTRSYQPYGEVLNQYGGAATSYGFTGEWTDSYINLIYLRARHYDPVLGRFLTKDTWKGSILQPMSLNYYNYGGGNPILRRDPSGKCWVISGNNSVTWYPDIHPKCKSTDVISSNRFSKMMGIFGDIAFYCAENSTDPYCNLQFIDKDSRSYTSLIEKIECNEWQIINYGKYSNAAFYTKSPVYWPYLNNDFDTMVPVPVLEFPIVLGAGGGISEKCYWGGGGCVEEIEGYSHGGPGIDIGNGLVQAHIGLRLFLDGETKIYLEGELFQLNCGIDVGFEGVEAYSPWGSIGIERPIHESYFILTSEKEIKSRGGYSNFGEFFIGQGYSTYYIYDRDCDREALLKRWYIKMMGYNDIGFPMGPLFDLRELP